MPDSSQNQKLDQTTLHHSTIQQTQSGRDALSFQNSPHAIVTINHVVQTLFPSQRQREVDWQWAKQILKQRQQPEIRGRLKDALIQQQQLWVELQEQPQQVGRNPLETVRQLRVGDQPPEMLEPGRLMLEVLGRDDIQGRLLILGVPGAGKTTVLLNLAEQLVIGALQNPETVIPVMFELSAWKDDRQSLEAWLIDQLYDNFGGNRKIYKQWLDRRVLLPLLDGLDELGMERQRHCATKINEFALHYPQLVVCCRLKEYEEAGVRLDRLQGAVCLQPLSDRQIQDYLTKIDRLALWDAVQASEEMRRLLEPDTEGEVGLLRVPLFVAMAAAVYEPSQRFGSKAELLEKYWERQLSRDTREGDRRQRVGDRRWAYKTVALEPDRSDTRRYLGWLARSLKANNQTELLLEKMQPKWLDTQWQKWQYRMMAGLISNLTYGLIFGLFFGTWTALLIYVVLQSPSRLIDVPDPMVAIVSVFLAFLALGLMIGLAFGVVFGLIGRFMFRLDNIQPVEAFQLSTSLIVKRKVLRGAIFGSAFGFVSGLFQGLPQGWVVMLEQALFYAIFYGVFYGVPYGLISGFREELKVRSRPNQGIWNSLRSMGFTAVLSYPLSLLSVAWYLPTQVSSETAEIKAAILSPLSFLSLGTGLSLFIGFWFGGGYPFLKHFTLRFVLSRHQLIPWHYVRFLNYCTERRLLQRVGGRYRFIHRELLEHLVRGDG
ncbi:MAG: NTPase (NACHT family) [Leptolyngbyaceae cyanobacterium CSU_1_4]|nr:NTPase (NACHT family) [Leptolyngbyaceae cyanobacterium CSU_1_4]